MWVGSTGAAQRGALLVTDERFWVKVNRSGLCWLWTGGVDSDGYGQTWREGRTKKAHRVAWEICHGAIPEGLFVLHNCPSGDNPRCVRPEHLWLGRHAENRADCVAKGRQAKADANGRALPESVIADVLRRSESGQSKRDISIALGIGTTTVGRIRAGRHWASRRSDVPS